MSDQKTIQVMLKEAGILFVITLLAGLLLGFVFELTKEPRRLQQEKAVQKACIAVFPGAVANQVELEFEEKEIFVSEEVSAELRDRNVLAGRVYCAYTAKDHSFYGMIVETTSKKGYGGDIVLFTGMDADGTVSGVSILSIKETAGLGMEAPSFLVPQFANRKVDEFVYVKAGGERTASTVDAISSATITTKAVTEAVNGGIKVAKELLKGGIANE